MKTIVLFTLLFAACFTTTFDIQSRSTCTQTSAAGFCTKWEQNGTVTETTSCFGAETLLLTEAGLKAMKDLRVGDKVLARKGTEDIYSPVVMWLHKKEHEKAEFLKLSAGKGSLLVSAKHNLALSEGGYTFAGEMLNKKVAGSEAIIDKIEEVQVVGVYAPLTEASNYYVFLNDGKTKALAHSYAHIRNPESYEWIVGNLLSAYEKVAGKSHEEGVNSGADWMMKKFSFLLE